MDLVKEAAVDSDSFVIPKEFGLLRHEAFRCSMEVLDAVGTNQDGVLLLL